MDIVVSLVQNGAASLASYLAAHVLLCLVPAFFIAGALAALVPQQSIIRFLGPNAPKYVSYSAAAGAGSLLAVCSCTIQPLFAGIYSKGAGLGPAITFLFFAPAANILALSYTGVALGADFAIARIVLALCFGIGIGLLMSLIFHRSEVARIAANATFVENVIISRQSLIFIATLVALLIAGTLKIDWLAAPVFSTVLPWDGAATLQALLNRLVPVNELKGEEGLSLQGLTLIGLLLLIGAAAWHGLGQVDNGFNRLTYVTLGLTAGTLIFAALGVRANEIGLAITLTGRTLAVVILCVVLLPQAHFFDDWDMQQWLWETWRFVKLIFPLLVVGVFLVGVIRSFIQPEWIQFIAGSNTVLANLAGVVFGVFMYFPTLVEVPIAKMFLSLGMHPGPLIAYLMADPELSLQSILITSAIIGKLKAWTYVGLVALFSTVAGLTYGAWIDGTPLSMLALIIGGFILTLTVAVQLIERAQRPAVS
ncbi:MAG: permease [Propionivibrio sp.]|uniref:Permease n=1 Tax=Candidatus Propionivibrio dominans TaxID=2954373 RepID=A0A9D7IHY3_9RHOO|nr:permease [Candidatus Propionivibrio dominans]MBL0166877.1 permease [Propionivibrio sp.]